MALQEFATMPLDDYRDAADAVREKLGTTDKIKSGELAELIRSIDSGGGGNILYNTKEYWSTQTSFIPDAGTLVIYSNYAVIDGEDIPAFKVGDGLAYVVDLPFSNDDLRAVLTAHIQNMNIHLSEEDRSKLDKSISATVEAEGDNSFNLILA